jgi:plastocyanin
MRFPVPVLTSVFVLAAVCAPVASAAPPKSATVPILAASFGSPRVEVLAGDTVTWHNTSFRSHTVSATDGSWVSQRLGAMAAFSHRFLDAGVATYYCQIHPFMRGEIDVHRLLLDAPRDAAVAGQPVVLAGRAALPAGAKVAIQTADGSAVASVGVDASGGFRTTVKPRTTTTFRAVSGGEASPAVRVLVLDRRVSASARAHGSRVVVKTHVRPVSRGATVVLQFRLRERFGWWPVRQARLDRKSAARFNVKLRRPVRARVVLVASDGATPLARSAPLRLAPR